MTVREARALGIAVATLREEDTRNGVDPIQSTERKPGRDALRKSQHDFANWMHRLVAAVELQDSWSVRVASDELSKILLNALLEKNEAQTEAALLRARLER